MVFNAAVVASAGISGYMPPNGQPPLDEIDIADFTR
jgi:hypothetical protein